ncbi:MAG: 50S ribosomal protein L11 methyltransferase [Peptococcaceae bacterium]|nr:50S ribosomal protein L11 methyltransferase [Peptococcaceae bacterium]
MKWLEISVSVRAEDIESVSNIYDDIGTGGVIIEDPAIIYDVLSLGNIETVAFETIPEQGSLPIIKGYLPMDEKLSSRLAEFQTALVGINSDYPSKINIAEIEDSSWSEKWREFYTPVKLGDRFLIQPSWLPIDEASEGLLIIEMDPGMAFGCGNHPTTAMCVEMLEKIVFGGEKVIDVGTGSGILSIVAALMGASSIIAVDSDSVAVKVARENVQANGLENIINVREGNLTSGIFTKFDIVVANIVADVINSLLPSVPHLLKDGGKFIASGIIAGRREEMARNIENSGLKIIKVINSGEWTGFLAEKP